VADIENIDVVVGCLIADMVLECRGGLNTARRCAVMDEGEVLDEGVLPCDHANILNEFMYLLITKVHLMNGVPFFHFFVGGRGILPPNTSNM
jgi:hypothetical protein